MARAPLIVDSARCKGLSGLPLFLTSISAIDCSCAPGSFQICIPWDAVPRTIPWMSWGARETGGTLRYVSEWVSQCFLAWLSNKQPVIEKAIGVFARHAFENSQVCKWKTVQQRDSCVFLPTEAKMLCRSPRQLCFMVADDRGLLGGKKPWHNSGLDRFLYPMFSSRSCFVQVPSYQVLGLTWVQIGKSSFVQISHVNYIFPCQWLF